MSVSFPLLRTLWLLAEVYPLPLLLTRVPSADGCNLLDLAFLFLSP